MPSIILPIFFFIIIPRDNCRLQGNRRIGIKLQRRTHSTDRRFWVPPFHESGLQDIVFAHPWKDLERYGQSLAHRWGINLDLHFLFQGQAPQFALSYREELRSLVLILLHSTLGRSNKGKNLEIRVHIHFSQYQYLLDFKSNLPILFEHELESQVFKDMAQRAQLAQWRSENHFSCAFPYQDSWENFVLISFNQGLWAITQELVFHQIGEEEIAKQSENFKTIAGREYFQYNNLYIPFLKDSTRSPSEVILLSCTQTHKMLALGLAESSVTAQGVENRREGLIQIGEHWAKRATIESFFPLPQKKTEGTLSPVSLSLSSPQEVFFDHLLVKWGEDLWAFPAPMILSIEQGGGQIDLQERKVYTRQYPQGIPLLPGKAIPAEVPKEIVFLATVDGPMAILPTEIIEFFPLSYPSQTPLDQFSGDLIWHQKGLENAQVWAIQAPNS